MESRYSVCYISFLFSSPLINMSYSGNSLINSKQKLGILHRNAFVGCCPHTPCSVCRKLSLVRVQTSTQVSELLVDDIRPSFVESPVLVLFAYDTVILSCLRNLQKVMDYKKRIADFKDIVSDMEFDITPKFMTVFFQYSFYVDGLLYRSQNLHEVQSGNKTYCANSAKGQVTGAIYR